MRECWVIEEQDKETDEWFTVDVTVDREHAQQMLKLWKSDYPHRVVRYVPADTVAQVAAPPQEDRKP